MNADLSSALAMALTDHQRRSGCADVSITSFLPKGGFYWELVAIKMGAYGARTGELHVVGSEVYDLEIPDLGRPS